MSTVDQLLQAQNLAPELMKGHGLQMRVLMIGPAEASALLAANTDNRPLRPGRVAYYRRAMLNGEWKLTHQGIAFSKDGVGMDLQHRLTAICEANMRLPFLVVEGLNADVFSAIDLHERRSMSDILAMRKELVEESRFILYLVSSNQGTSPTPNEIREVANEIQAASDELWRYCPSKRKVFSTVSVRVAAIILMTEKPKIEAVVMQRYRALVLQSYDEMTDAMKGLNRQVADGKVARGTGIASHIDMAARALKVLTPGNESISRIMIKADPGEMVRDRLKKLLSISSSNSPAFAEGLQEIDSSTAARTNQQELRG